MMEGSLDVTVPFDRFRDGIMGAVDIEMDVEKKPDPKGDRVGVTLDGSFLPYRKW